MIRQGSSAARAIRDDFKPLIKQISFKEILQDLPFGFDIFILVSDISRIKINPIGNPLRHAFPLFDIRKSRFFTKSVKFRDAVLFDLLFIGKSQLLFHFDFDRQAVCIPTAAADNMIPLHRTIAKDYILNGARNYMMYTGFSVCGRRTFIEHILTAAFAIIG
ncbi:MAG: hypothetical protein BWY58_01072 [Chloroflexi bacterium ADurb.Bin344]|nr:MAG: hypothetical protein BWY58_01072 [Chloroflexi bacterium ADurb.Bin344]